MHNYRLQFHVRWQHCPTTAEIDFWMRSCFGLQPSVIQSNELSLQLDWVTRGLWLQREWLQAARVPLLDLGRVVSLVPLASEEEIWELTLDYQMISKMSTDLLHKSWIWTLEIMVWMARHSAEISTHRNVLFQTLAQKWIVLFSKQQAGGGSTLPLLRTAHRLGIPILPLGHGIYQFGWGKNAVRLHRSVTEHDSALAMVVCQQKILTCEWLGKEGFPVTQPLRAETLEDAVLAARQLGWPVVIKPIDADRCEGVTLGINSETAVKEATLHALQFGSRQLVLVEQQVKGQCHRLFVANGTLLYAIERKPLELIGDGLKTLHQLIDEYNDALSWSPPWSHEKPVIFDEAMSDHLALQGIDANQILKNEKSVTLHPFDSPIWGGTDIDRTDEIHPENRSLAEAVAASLGLDVAGIDFITPDIRIPWHQNNAQVIEVNFAPMLGMWPISEGYLPTFFERYCKNRGQIPFHWINGDSEVAWQRGLIRQKLRWNQGSPSYLVSELMTLRPDGTVLPRVLKSLRERVFALLLSREVEEVIVVTEFSTVNPLADLVNHWDTVECIRSKSNGISGAV